jgi:putative transcriptional regulator
MDASRVASYVLGTLPDDARAEFEQRMAVSPALRDEVAAVRAVVEELLLAAPAVAPRASVRERLLARVATEAIGAAGRAAAGAGAGVSPGSAAAVSADASPRAPRPPLPELLFALEPEATWKDMGPGIQLRVLARSAEGSSYVLRVAPGGTIPAHEHRRVEHSYILSGSLVVGGILCHAGDYHRAAAGTHHEPPYSEEGCLVLIVESAA